VILKIERSLFPSKPVLLDFHSIISPKEEFLAEFLDAFPILVEEFIRDLVDHGRWRFAKLETNVKDKNQEMACTGSLSWSVLVQIPFHLKICPIQSFATGG
jgi:hypothetical protein